MKREMAIEMEPEQRMRIGCRGGNEEEKKRRSKGNCIVTMYQVSNFLFSIILFTVSFMYCLCVCVYEFMHFIEQHGHFAGILLVCTCALNKLCVCDSVYARLKPSTK